MFRKIKVVLASLVVLLAALVIPCSHCLSFSQPHTHHRKKYPCVDRPFVGMVEKSQGTIHAEIIVVGTSHFRCQSAQEVKQTIQETSPDGVVIELDPERVVRLTKEYSMVSPDQPFGADFLSAIQTAQDDGIPLFLGDEDPKTTKDRFVSTILTPSTYDPSYLIRALNPFKTSQISVFQSFVDDPRKALPILSSMTVPLLSLVGLGLHGDVHPPGFHAVESSLPIIAATGYLAVKFFNTLITDRDKVIADKSLEAVTQIANLKRKKSVRKTWRFSADDGARQFQHSDILLTTTDSGAEEDREANDNERVSLFTLKTPLKAYAFRNLNLFEPRWLAMIDSLRNKSSASFGCVTCSNKFYSVVKGDNGEECRYADVIFQRKARMAKLLKLQEGSRPSGARKVNVTIQGDGNEFYLADEDRIIVSKQGYLSIAKSDIQPVEAAPSAVPEEPLRLTLVIVVGLLHANGVLELLKNNELKF